MHELKRIFCDPHRWIILLLIAAINLALFAGYCRSVPEQTPEETAAYLEYIANGYTSYLDRVSTQSEEQSILSNLRPADDFVTRNLKKTRSDYAMLQGLAVQSGENRGICAVTDFGVTDYLLLILPLLLVFSFASERSTQITELLRATQNGRVRLTCLRIAAVFLCACISVFVLYGSNIIFAHGLFGDPDYTRAIQSVPMFQLCAFRMCIREYLLYTALIKAAAVWLTALTVWLIWAMFHQVPAILISAGIFGTAWLCHRLILPTASANWLKFCNLFAMLSPETYFTHYANLNLCGKPHGFLFCMLIWGGICLALAAGLCILLLGICRPVMLGAAAERFKDRISKLVCRFLPRYTLFGYEGRKILLSEGGILVLLAGMVYGISLYRSMQVRAPMNPDLTAIYMEYEGEVSDEKVQHCDRKINMLEEAVAEREHTLARIEQLEHPDQMVIMDLQSEIRQLQYQIELYTAFLERMQSLITYRAETGFDAWLIRQNGWNLLFTESAPMRRCSTALLIVLVFLFAPVFAYEAKCGVTPLLRSTKNGRGVLLDCKLCWVLLLTLLASAAFHGIFFSQVVQTKALPLPDAPAHSLELLRILPVNLSLQSCVIGLYLLRYLAALMIAAAVLCISRLSRHPQAALLTALAVCVLPAALAEIGMPLPDPVQFLCLCAGSTA